MNLFLIAKEVLKEDSHSGPPSRAIRSSAAFWNCLTQGVLVCLPHPEKGLAVFLFVRRQAPHPQCSIYTASKRGSKNGATSSPSLGSCKKTLNHPGFGVDYAPGSDLCNCADGQGRWSQAVGVLCTHHTKEATLLRPLGSCWPLRAVAVMNWPWPSSALQPGGASHWPTRASRLLPFI